MADDIRIEQHGREITKTGLCTVSGKPYAVTVTVSQYNLWRDSMKIQNAMPDLSAEQREFWISGTTPDEWRQMFPQEEEED